MGIEARGEFERKYTEVANYRRLMDIYEMPAISSGSPPRFSGLS